MPVIGSEIDRETLSLVVTTELDAPVERVWQLWADPRQLERWWGPPGWPASFPLHDFVVGGESRYRMTGPEGEISAGWLRFTRLEPPHRIELDDGFAGDDGEPNSDMPTMRMVIDIAPTPEGRARMSIRTVFASIDDLEQITGMGMAEGMTAAMGQIDAIVAERAA